MDEQYVSGDWVVKPGNEEEFARRWLAFTEWSQRTMPGAQRFLLLRDEGAPGHYISMGIWDDRASIDAWRNHREFARLRAEVVALCDSFHGSDFTMVASPATV